MQRAEDTAVKGSCLCGAVAYEVTALAGPIVNCSCRTCRKAHAAPFASTARVDRAAFRWTKGQDRGSAFSSTPGKLRHFCPACGSHLMAEWQDEPRVIIRVATLDDDPQQRPEIAIWRSHEVPWLNYHEPMQVFDETPSPRA
jgi:hypothetical protein